mmetsp:Transcript_4940/g.10616  ORF Transcript_4940/g.10616 Transcript_4940/m.10616 type:complete len:83 (+) Transcript_4940:291-539(+)
MSDSFDAASFDSRWRDDGLGWHGRRGADGKQGANDGGSDDDGKRPGWVRLAEMARRYVEGYACGRACAGHAAGGLSGSLGSN